MNEKPACQQHGFKEVSSNGDVLPKKSDLRSISSNQCDKILEAYTTLWHWPKGSQLWTKEKRHRTGPPNFFMTNGFPLDNAQLLTKASFTVVFTLGCHPFLILFASSVAAKLVYCLLWTSKCDFKPEVWVNRLPHKSQANGFSPEWMRMCTFRLPDWVKVLKQQGHWYGRSPLWILMWT